MAEGQPEKLEKDVREKYFQLLRFPSVSSHREHLRDCVNCAVWLKKELESWGFAGKLQTPSIRDGHASPPILFMERKGSEGAPTVLIYGHYDVQPADPIELWQTSPFEPEERDGVVYARGANDDKGQTFALLTGLKDFIQQSSANGREPTLKIILDGQEEMGSPALTELLPEMRRQLSADILLVCDTDAAANLRPAIVAGLRGVSHLTVRLKGPMRDVHSGTYGGVAPNPARGLAQLMATLHDARGRIAVDGFYEGVIPPSEEELQRAAESAASPECVVHAIGCAPLGGEKNLPLYQRQSFEPTIELNGIHSGYGGAGSKTIIPSEALAKLSLRLVPGQSPKHCLAALQRHLEERVPEGLKLSIEEVNEGAGGFRLPLNSPIFRLAASVLTELDARGPVFVWEGASIPILSLLQTYSGAAPLIVGWGQPENFIHSPNENYSLRQFAQARRWGRKLMEALAGMIGD